MRASSTWHGYVNVSARGGFLLGMQQGGLEGGARGLYVPAHRHSIVQIRTCLYVPGTCLTHTFPTWQGEEDFHA